MPPYDLSLKEKQKEYRLANKEALQEKKKEYVRKNKEAISKKQKEYRLQNREILSEKKKEYYLKNKEIVREKQKDYYLKNQKVLTEKQKEYALKNKDKIAAKQKEYYSKNKDVLNEKQKEYAQKNREAISKKQKEYVRKNKEVLKRKQKEYKLKHKKRITEKQKDYYLRNKKVINKQQKLNRLKKRGYVRKNTNWSLPEEARMYFEKAKERLHINDLSDWYRVSRAQIKGSRAFVVHKTLGHALKFAYPEFPWELDKFSFRGKKSAQRWLRVMLEKVLPERCEIFEDYLHPDLVWDKSKKPKMELDLWVPKFCLALEYQGEHHYLDLHTAFGPNGISELCSKRDLEKKNACAEKGITLAVIPYWWDGSQESLAATLHLLLPDVFPKVENAVPIPDEPPAKSLKTKDLRVEAMLMHGIEWDNKQDPTGWFISEKLDGLRAFWDGTNLLTRRGRVIPAPLLFTRDLPPGVALDGELWAGYNSFYKILSTIAKIHKYQPDQTKLEQMWQGIKYFVFDAPYCSGTYQLRHQFAQKHILCKSPFMEMIPYVVCLGEDHLQQILREVHEREGEGIILYDPKAFYTPGRTSNILKLKISAGKESSIPFSE